MFVKAKWEKGDEMRLRLLNLWSLISNGRTQSCHCKSKQKQKDEMARTKKRLHEEQFPYLIPGGNDKSEMYRNIK